MVSQDDRKISHLIVENSKQKKALSLDLSISVYLVWAYTFGPATKDKRGRYKFYRAAAPCTLPIIAVCTPREASKFLLDINRLDLCESYIEDRPSFFFFFFK